MIDAVAERPGFRGYGRDFRRVDWARAHREQHEDWQAGLLDLHDGRLLGNPTLKRPRRRRGTRREIPKPAQGSQPARLRPRLLTCSGRAC